MCVSVLLLLELMIQHPCLELHNNIQNNIKNKDLISSQHLQHLLIMVYLKSYGQSRYMYSLTVTTGVYGILQSHTINKKKS